MKVHVSFDILLVEASNMKIDVNNYEEFYFGSACEAFIQSEFYALGYEALKTAPDIGYDLLVTNCARTKFLSEDPRQYNIQVKGKVCYKNIVKFYIKSDDLLMLLNDPNGYLVCVFCYPVLSDSREEITVYRVSDPVAQGHIFEDWADGILSEVEGISLKFLKENNIPYVGYEKEYLWFNNAQLKWLNDKGYIFDYKDNKYLCFKIEDDTHRKSPVDSAGEPLTTSELYECDGHYAYEQEHINYLVSCDINDPMMFWGDQYI